MSVKLFWRVLALLFLIALALVGKVLFDIRKLDALDGQSTTKIYNLNNTQFYVTKKVWGLLGNSELTIISPNKELSEMLFDSYEPNFEGLICFTADSTTIIEGDTLVTYCHDSHIPLEQEESKIWNGVKVSLISHSK